MSGLATVGLLAWPVVVLISSAGNGGQGEFVTAAPTMTRTVTVTQPVTSLSVESYGAPIQVTAGPVHHITVTEAISYPGPGPTPAVTAAVSDRKLTLDASSCADTGCSVGFTVTVPPGVSVTAESDNGGIAVAGVAGANLDSGGGPVQASHIDGPLSVTSEDGGITVSDVSAPGGTNLDSGGGPVQASHIDGPLTISSEDGGITVSDVTAPGVNLDSGGGPVQVGRVNGPLTVTSEDGGVTVNDLTGDLDADTGGGSFAGTLAAGRASVLTEDGSAALTFSTAAGLRVRRHRRRPGAAHVRPAADRGDAQHRERLRDRERARRPVLGHRRHRGRVADGGRSHRVGRAPLADRQHRGRPARDRAALAAAP